ncbi:replication initiation factor [Sulfuritortus calidifontis]|uniref:Replication initiation factor n=1 Tax=Sulfuritortus calidifontis TaxID=1914471 RepID=A0A4R3JUI9_9PROT|nr:replication initiation factor [Sulfuritortus calidifontis]
MRGRRASPRIVTTGGNSFPSENPSGALPRLAHVDWLAFTIAPPEVDPIRWLLPHLAALFGVSSLTSRGKGAFGYSQSYDLGGHGILAVGGKGQKGTAYVSLTGAGCAHVKDWQAVQDWLEANGARLKRVDVAHDDHDGETLSIERAVEWYNADGFSTGGRRPGHQVKGDWLTAGSPKGRTLYIGNRANGKMARIYEKGKQLGDPESPWVRAEVEFKDQSRVLPYDMLTRPGVYLAGAYACFGFLSIIQEKVRTIAKAAKIALGALVHYAKQAYGPLVNVLMAKHGKNAAAVVAELIRPGVPRRLADYPPGLAGAAT